MNTKHNHAYSRSIPVKCGYVSGAYNDFATKATTTDDSNYEIIEGLKILKNEVQGDGSTEIDRKPHPADGVYYVLNEACGLV